MVVKKIAREFLARLKERGYEGRIVSARHIPDLKEEIEKQHRLGLFDEEFYRERLIYYFNFNPPKELRQVRSIIVVAVPQPQIEVIFNWKKESYHFIIPPTYIGYIDEEVRVLLDEVLSTEGYKTTRAVLPQKLLAVRSGLGFYGRNNICYVPGMGSFHRLMVFYSDLPCSEDSWQEPKMNESCEDCQNCLDSCPTGAIGTERFLLRAELCLTFHNEREKDFPGWLNPAWHHCLVGCLRCQEVCPRNSELLSWIETKGEFSEEETSLLLKGLQLDKLPAETVKKLEELDLIEYLKIISRNLSVILKKKTN
jgi:epoxyqueuosine reductase